MNLFKSKHWMAIAIGLLSGPALAATSCEVTPAYSIITEGQTLQLTAVCTGTTALTSIEWKMSDTAVAPVVVTSVTGLVSLPGYVAGDPIKYTTPVGLGDAKETQEFVFTVGGVPGDLTSTSARVVVKPSSAVLAVAKYGSSANTSKTPGACGTADSGAVTAMPTGTAQCAIGSAAALPISGPQSFTWSCLSLTGGAEASCYAMRGFTVTANAEVGGSISPPSQPVTAGGTASFTASPATGYSAAISGCGGTQSGNNFTTGPVTANCNVTARFSTQPAVNGACGGSNGQTFSTAPTTGLCTTGGAPAVATGTSTYTWSCSGSNGGTAASCSADIQSVSASSPNSDPGTGSWIPPNTTGRLIANQSGTTAQYLTSYIPGCLNGTNITSSSNSGCGGKSSYTDPATGASFGFGSGKTLGLRYTSKAGAGAAVRYFNIASGDGGNVGQTVKVWLSDSPTATFDATAATCRTSSTQQPYLITGPGFCAIQPNKRYYLFISTDAVGTYFRYLVNENTSDFY
jgi:hypothetical protein